MNNKKVAKRKKNDPQTRIADLSRIKRDIEAQIFMLDEDELQLLAPLYLLSAFNILIAIKKDPKIVKIILQEFVNGIKDEIIIH